MTINNRWVLVAAMAIISVCVSTARAEGAPRVPAKITDKIPSPVYRLSLWPNETVLNGPMRVDEDSLEKKTTKISYREWIHHVLAEPWRPPVSAKPVFLRSEFDGRDTIRIAWRKDDYKVELSQTATIFIVKITPLDARKNGVDKKEKIAHAKKICGEIFNVAGERRTGQGVKVAIPRLRETIVTDLFEDGKIQAIQDGAVWGRSKSREEAGVRAHANEHETELTDDPANENWANSPASWMYWFRNITWWNDGQSVCFCFWKIEAGPWIPGYGGSKSVDKNWFRAVPKK